MMFLKVWVSPKHCLIHQELEIPCQGRKRGRFFQGVKRFQIKFLESNILCGGINCLPDKHLWSSHTVPHTVRGTGETRACELTGWWERHAQAGNDSRICSGCWGDTKERWLFQFRGEESSNAFWRQHNSSALFL